MALGIPKVILNPLVSIPFDYELSLGCVIALLILAALGEHASVFEITRLQYHNTARGKQNNFTLNHFTSNGVDVSFKK